MTEQTSPPAPQNLDELMRSGIEFVRSCFDDQGSFLPQWILQKKDGSLMMVCTPWGSEYEKNATANKMRELIKEHDVIRYVMMSEVWGLMMDPNKPDPDYTPGMSLEHHPHRIEFVAYVGGDINGEAIVARQIITRNDAGDPTLGEYEVQDYTGIKGRFVDLFKDAAPLPEGNVVSIAVPTEELASYLKPRH